MTYAIRPPTPPAAQVSSIPAIIDPVRDALKHRLLTGHIVRFDDGQRLMSEFARAAAASGGATTVTVTVPDTDADTNADANATPTLGDVPFRFVRVEVDEEGEILPLEKQTPSKSGLAPGTKHGERRGLLAEFFHPRDKSNEGAWFADDSPPAFAEGYPFSADNVDVDELMVALEDDNDLLDVDDTRWVLWMGVSTAPGGPDPTQARPFDMRTRILNINDLLGFFNSVRTRLAPGQALPTVYFIVAVSYVPALPLPASMVESRDRIMASLGQEYLDMAARYSQGPYDRYRGVDFGDCGDVVVVHEQDCAAVCDDLSDESECEHSDDEASASQRTPDSSNASVSSASVSSERQSVESVKLPLLQTLDTNAAKGDAVEGDLHALLPEAHSPTDAQWRDCCALLCLDPEAHKDARARSVAIPGTDNMCVKPSQLWTAYWMLASRADRNLCGGVLADVMGTGKTYVVLVVCLLRAYIAYNRAEVEREWQLRDHEAAKKPANTAPKQHLPRTVAGSASTPCPCGNALGIECYANPGGITRRLADRLSRGAALILAPQTVLDNWVKTVRACRLQPKFFEPVVFNAKMTKEDTGMAPAPRLKQKLQMDVKPRPGTSADGLFPATWTPDVLDAVHAYTPSISKDAYPERFLLFATHAPDKLVDFFQLPVPLRRKAGAGTRERKTVYGCPVGIQLVDEFHKAKADVLTLAQHHKHVQSGGGGGDGADHFDFWAITGTPLPAKLTDLAGVTEIVQRLPAWDAPDSLHHGTRVCALHALQDVYDQAVSPDGTPALVDEFRARAAQFFQGGLLKRHTEASTFFGQRIFSLQDVAPAVVVHTTPAGLRADVAQVVARVGATLRAAMTDTKSADAASPNWEQAVRASTLFNHMMDLEILATFPGAARLMLAHPPAVDFGLAAIRAEIRKAEDGDVAKVPLFQQHLDTVIEGSPHLATILATVDRMAHDRQRRRALPAPVVADANTRSALPPKKVDLAMKKLVVLCPRMGEAVFVFLALRKLRPAFRPVFLHHDLKMAERTALLQDFNKLDAPTPAGTIGQARILVGTFRDAGTGNDLTVASYQILTGPLRLRSQQDQAFGRTNREGQSLRLHHQLLVAEDSPVDRIVMATQARRRIVSDPFNMDDELVLAPVEVEDEGVEEAKVKE